MGGKGVSNTQSSHIQFGNQSGYNDLSSLFGGNRVFNLGAGASSFDINTNSIDLSSFMKGGDAKNTASAEGGEGGGFDVAASVGVGVGGGSGSGGSVEKSTQNPFQFPTMSSGSGGSNNMPIYIALGVVCVGMLLIVFTGKRRH